MTAAGIYLHIPVCSSRCSYCDFATGMYQAELAERYVEAVVKEIERWDEVNEPRAAETIYFGGGTPSLLSPAQLENILGALHARFAVSPDAETTIEINPGSITTET